MIASSKTPPGKDEKTLARLIDQQSTMTTLRKNVVKDIRVGNKVKKGAKWTFTPETQPRGLYLTLTLNSTSFSLGKICGTPKQPEVEGTQFKWVPVSWVLVYILTSSSLPSLHVQSIKTTDFSQKI